MPHDITYCVCDVETDGPTPGVHALRSIGIVAFDEAGVEIDAFAANLEPLPDTTPDPDTMAWWATEPDAWAAATIDAQPAETVMRDLLSWLHRLPAPRMLVAHPLAFDGAWLDAYLRRFTDQQVFAMHPNASPFAGAGIDIATFVHATFDVPLPVGLPTYPEALRRGAPHDHTPLTDARGHAATFFNARALGRDPEQRARVRALMLQTSNGTRVHDDGRAG